MSPEGEDICPEGGFVFESTDANDTSKNLTTGALMLVLTISAPVSFLLNISNKIAP